MVFPTVSRVCASSVAAVTTADIADNQTMPAARFTKEILQR